jgi:hypothetical protein
LQWKLFKKKACSLLLVASRIVGYPFLILI